MFSLETIELPAVFRDPVFCRFQRRPSETFLKHEHTESAEANVKGDKRILDLLNEVLTGELTAASQYFLHAKMCKNWGYDYLGGKIYKESIEEMKHADKLVERILFLEGLPNLQKLHTLAIGQAVAEILESDLSLERATVPRLNGAVTLCREVGDNGSEELLLRILVDSENHVDWLESQVELIRQIGEQHYLAQQIRG